MKNRKKMDAIFKEIYLERLRQDEKWGIQKRVAFDWIPILGEEFGEVCKAALESQFERDGLTWEDYRRELIQLAATAVLMIQNYDEGLTCYL